uniref:DUF1758 domain-containing protein n=1 Tax=Loa loa TaxID=7209 RepID=A0A1I7VAC2_LOALO
MSTSLNKSTQPTIDRVIELLEEIKKLDLSPPDRNQPLEDQKQQYEIKKRIVKDKAKRFEIYVGMLETINEKWLDLIQQATKITKKEEEEKYEKMVNDKQAIHLQGIPNIQKLTYLTSCLKGEALEAIRGFDIAPENYELIRQVLIDKYGNPATIKKSLYNEFYSIQRNDREWKSRVEAMEKILRQLEALGEDLEHSSIEVTIESRLPPWILDKVYQMKTEGETWTISKLRQFLMESKTPSGTNSKKSTSLSKGGETSALSITKQFKSTEARNLQLSNKTKFNKEKRPCIFCNKNHWDNECPNCLTVKQRFERLKELKACTNCFRTMHATSDCKQRKRTCFHCKGQHNTALCYKKYGSLNNGSNNEETNSTIIINSLNQPINYQGKKVLLICKEIEAVNPTQLEIQEEALVLFDSGSQSSFISKKLANRLSLTETKKEELKLFSFGNQFPKLYQTSKVKIGIRALKSNIIPINVYVLDYLTDKLQIINPTSYDINYITNQKQLDDSEGYWRRPDIIIGADHFFEFMQPYKVHHIDQFWKLEVIGIQEQPNEHDDEKALEQFKNCITKENNRYQVSWPWKDSKINLQDNYGLCYGRLRTLIKRLQTNPSLLECYDEIIKEQLQSNIIEKVTTNMDQEGIIHYLPHHEVLTPGKATTKLRIVYDASAHINGEKSLNNVLYRGPTTLPDLAGVLLRFRMMKNVIIADIEKAFLQLELHPSDRNCTRFLWLKDIQGEITKENLACYRFQRVPFGIIASPFLLSATLNYHLETYGSATALEIKKNLYVDNVILPANGTQEAFKIYKEMKDIFKNASMNIREFFSNDNDFNKLIPENDRAESLILLE